MQALLKVLSLVVAALFLGGAVLTAVSERALAATPPVDGGVDAGQRMFFPASKAGPVRRPRALGDAGEPAYFPASKSFGGESLPGVKQQLLKNEAP